MSGMGTKNIDSLLPEDIEARLANIHLVISKLEADRIAIEKDITEKKSEQEIVNSRLQDSLSELSRITAASETISTGLKEREDKIAQKESALDVYANALQEKEKKINKYLTIFENMKDIVIK